MGAAGSNCCMPECTPVLVDALPLNENQSYSKWKPMQVSYGNADTERERIDPWTKEIVMSPDFRCHNTLTPLSLSCCAAENDDLLADSPEDAGIVLVNQEIPTLVPRADDFLEAQRRKLREQRATASLAEELLGRCREHPMSEMEWKPEAEEYIETVKNVLGVQQHRILRGNQSGAMV
mmetsp:Transcript_126668/g.370096  ORF Transcript_126668/g.370096 Transcript_126668/m.370096 type:complete len:178 (+) Transcript_126668:127-660(+)